MQHTKKASDKVASTALVSTAPGGVVAEGSAERPLPAHLIQGVAEYVAASHADNTKRAYSQAWGRFETWCRDHGRVALPAAPETVAAWIVALAIGDDGRKPLASTTINLYLAAVAEAHRTAGQPFDRGHPVIARSWQGMSRTKARERAARKASPLMGDQLRELVTGLDLARSIDARDACLLTLGWAAALRRSELVGLDWRKQGEGAGFVEIVDRGIRVVLATSKGSQAAATEIAIPCEQMRAACDALERWAALADLQAGAPLFREVNKGGALSERRLSDRSVSRIVKARVRALVQAKGKTPEEAAEIVARFSGHSMRAGYATTAGAMDVPGHRIKDRMRHKSMDTTTGYIRAGRKWGQDSGLGGLGF